MVISHFSFVFHGSIGGGLESSRWMARSAGANTRARRVGQHREKNDSTDNSVVVWRMNLQLTVLAFMLLSHAPP